MYHIIHAPKYLLFQSPTTLMQLRAVQHQARRNRWYDNIAMTFFGQKTAARKHSEHKVPSEEELLNALEGKYDALKDKLIAQSLLNELGASVWERLSKKERQAEILKIRLQDKKLRKEGRFDEANRSVEISTLFIFHTVANHLQCSYC